MVGIRTDRPASAAPLAAKNLSTTQSSGFGRIITIDGYVGTGKTTLAKWVAEKLDFLYVDTGAMYRCFTHYKLKHGVDLENAEALAKALEKFAFNVEVIGGEKHYFVEGEDVTTRIRGQEVTQNVSRVAACLAVREKLAEWQRDLAIGKNVVFEGRDMGSHVFKDDASLKIYLTANVTERVERRFKEIKAKNPTSDITKKVLREQILERDLFDSSRQHSPTAIGKGAYVIKTDDITIEEVGFTILSFWRDCMQEAYR